jgi:hypothetical protein
VKRVPEGRHLLTDNDITVNGKKETDDVIEEQLYQKPNSSILGYRLRLNLFNLANPNPDSTFKAKFKNNPGRYERMAKLLSKKQVDRLGKSFYYFGIHNFLKKSGEAPVIIDEKSAKKSANRLRAYYFNDGYFDVTSDYIVDTVAAKKAKIAYSVVTGNPYHLDTITAAIRSPQLDSLYRTTLDKSFLKTGSRYRTENFDNEKNRISTSFRNNGVYQFQQNYVKFDIDTVGMDHKANVKLVIDDYSYREGDSTRTMPFKIFRISRVNIFTADPDDKTFSRISDSVTYNNFNLYSTGKLRYKPKAITNAVFINKDGLFADYKTTLTSRYLSNLHVFNYPTIQYAVDSTGNALIANIYLVSNKKYNFHAGLDFSHSNIQDFGISGNTSITIRNIFRGAETLEIAARGNIGSSKDFANPDNSFFNVSEYGTDVKLSFPRLFFPFNTERIIPKRMTPSTAISFGLAKQQNIGLDKENMTGAITYNWTPKRFTNARFDLLNIQYVNNVNVANYYNVYKSSYGVLNDLAQEYGADPADVNENGDLTINEGGANNFTNDVLDHTIPTSEEDFKTVTNIEERRLRLTENNLIFATSYIYTKTKKRFWLD